MKVMMLIVCALTGLAPGLVGELSADTLTETFSGDLLSSSIFFWSLLTSSCSRSAALLACSKAEAFLDESSWDA